MKERNKFLIELGIICPKCQKGEVKKQAERIADFGTPKSHLVLDWVNISCPICGWSVWDRYERNR